MKRFTKTELKGLKKLDLYNAYLEIETAFDKNEEVINKIETALPDTNKKLWWLINLSKIIKLIIEILRTR